jgi:hypothetical protein
MTWAIVYANCVLLVATERGSKHPSLSRSEEQKAAKKNVYSPSFLTFWLSETNFSTTKNLSFLAPWHFGPA